MIFIYYHILNELYERANVITNHSHRIQTLFWSSFFWMKMKNCSNGMYICYGKCFTGSIYQMSVCMCVLCDGASLVWECVLSGMCDWNIRKGLDGWMHVDRNTSPKRKMWWWPTIIIIIHTFHMGSVYISNQTCSHQTCDMPLSIYWNILLFRKICLLCVQPYERWCFEDALGTQQCVTKIHRNNYKIEKFSFEWPMYALSCIYIIYIYT